MAISLELFHTTIGKYVHGFELRCAHSTRIYPSFPRILLRETVGRLGASVLFGIGYWGLNGNWKHQAWSDRISDTYLAWRPVNRRRRRGLIIAIVVVLAVGASLVVFGLQRNKSQQALVAELTKAAQDSKSAGGFLDALQSQQVNSIAALKTRSSQVAGLLDEISDAVARVQRTLTALEAFASADESIWIASMHRLYGVKEQQIRKKLREEVKMVDAFDAERDDADEFLRGLTAMDREVESLNQELRLRAGAIQGKSF